MEEQPLQPEAVLAQLVQENQSLRAEMQHLRARFDAANLAVATQTATNDQGSNSSRLARDPKPFSGQRDVVEPFLDHVRLVLRRCNKGGGKKTKKEQGRGTKQNCKIAELLEGQGGGGRRARGSKINQIR